MSTSRALAKHLAAKYKVKVMDRIKGALIDGDVDCRFCHGHGYLLLYRGQLEDTVGELNHCSECKKKQVEV